MTRFNLPAQEQPIPGMLVVARESYVILYYADFQGDGEHIIQWNVQYDDDGNVLEEWQPTDYGTPERFLSIYKNYELFQRQLALARSH